MWPRSRLRAAFPRPSASRSRSSPTARARRCERDGHTILSYGPAPGYGPLREWLAERHGVEPARVVLTNGSLQGFVFLRPPARAGQAGARRAADLRPAAEDPPRARGARSCRVDCDDEGLDPDALAAALRGASRRHSSTRSRPSRTRAGARLSAERRGALVELARERELLVLEDDPYGLVRYEGEPLPSLFELAGGERSPTARRSRRRSRPGSASAGSSCPTQLAREVEATAASTYITPRAARPGDGARVRPPRPLRAEPRARDRAAAGAARRDADALDRALPGMRDWTRPEGGYFVWLELAGRRRRASCSRAPSSRRHVRPGRRLRRRRRAPLRLAFSFVSPGGDRTRAFSDSR